MGTMCCCRHRCCCCIWYCCHTGHGHACHGLPWVAMGVLPTTVSHCISNASTCKGVGMWGTKTGFDFCCVGMCGATSMFVQPFQVVDLVCAAVSHPRICPSLSATVMVGYDFWLLSSQDCLRFHWRTPGRLTFLYLSHRPARCHLMSFASWVFGNSLQIVHCNGLQWRTLQPRPRGLLPGKRFNWCQGIAFCCQPRALSQPVHSTDMLKSCEIYATFAYFSCWYFEVADTWMFADICWLPGPATYSICKLKWIPQSMDSTAGESRLW